MVTVEMDAANVERRLLAGEIGCPGCRGVLGGWGHARPRVVRGPTGDVRVTPRRARCRSCRASHVLLPRVLLCRRADTVDVIGAAVVAHAAGAGHRPIAAALGRPGSTVRGWLRRLGGRLDRVREVFTARAIAFAVDPGAGHDRPMRATGSAWAELVAAVTAAARAVAARLAVGAVTAWQIACVISGGSLLSPGWPPLA